MTTKLPSIPDEFAAAIADFFASAPRRKVARLRAATSALIEAAASGASVQSATSVGPLYQHQDAADERAKEQQRYLKALDIREGEAEDRLDALEETEHTHEHEVGH